MMKKISILMSLTLVVAGALFVLSRTETPASTPTREANWLIDFEAAKAIALAEGKPMLLNFSGSDWCILCIKLQEEVFSQDAFVEYSDASLVLVSLDFPIDEFELPIEVTQQNKMLYLKYNVPGFPMIVILSPEGELVGKTTYQRGGAEAYVEHIKEFVAEI